MRPALTRTPQIIHTDIDAQPAVLIAQMRSAESVSTLGEYHYFVC